MVVCNYILCITATVPLLSTKASALIPRERSCHCYWVSLVVETCFCLYVFPLYCLLLAIQLERKKKKRKQSFYSLQCHFVGELFSYLSAQIISNASANSFNVSTFSKQRVLCKPATTFSKHYKVWSSNLFCSLDLQDLRSVHSAFPMRK